MYKHIKEMLQSGLVIHVEFTKKNGDVRNMNCTTNLELIPESHHPAEKKTNTRLAEVSEDVVRAYDIDAEGWRSFRVDSVNVIETKKP
ncbi:SH3 beta-barrel fold-containing protein [bacterium]|nr:SH3 beta-barrel fold-containing protein [bacterium]